MDQNEINLTIKAKDEATAAIEKLTAKVEELTKKMGEASKSSDSLTQSQAATAKAHDSMAASVFKGVASWDVLKKAVSTATDFLVSSTEAYLEAQKQIDLTRAVVESMGQSYDVVAPKLKEFGDKMAKMGTDDEAANLAAAKFAKTLGGDLNKGMQMAKLAADLTASGYNDFAGNVDNLSRVLSGKGQRALMDYRVNLDASASTAEQLNAIQEKVTQTTEEYANTIPGRIATVKEAYTNLKEEVGSSFVASIMGSISASEGMTETLDTMKIAGQGLSIAVYEVVQGFMAVIKTAQLVGAVANDVVASFVAISKAAKGDFKGAGVELQAATDFQNEAFKSLIDTLSNMTSPIENLKKNQEALTEASKKSAAGHKDAFTGITNTNTSAGTSADKLKGKYQDLADALTKVRQTATDELQSLAKSHDDAVTSATSRIADLKKSLKDLGESYTRASNDAATAYSRQASGDKSGIADQVVAQQQKIADLQKQAGMETDPQKRVALQLELKKEQDAYAEQADFIASISDAVTEAKRKASLTDFERAIEDYKARRAQADQDYADARADALREYTAKSKEIKLQMTQEQAKLDEENAKYKKAHDSITKTIADAEALRLDIAKKSSDQVIALVDAQIQRYNRLAEAISRASSGKAEQVAPASMPVHEFGGTVPGAVGTAVPIIAHGQERIIPASKTSDTAGGGVISITINNPQVRNDGDLAAMRKMIEDAFRDVSRVHRLTTI